MLLIALLIIWSIVGYKFINGFFAKREMPELSLSLPINYSENLVIRDTFKLKQLRRDPFLGSYEKSFLETKVFTPSKVAVKKSNSWPKIEYFGYVQSENSNHPLILLKIDNKLIRIRKGTQKDHLIIKEVYEDSILVLNGKDRKMFLKQ